MENVERREEVLVTPEEATFELWGFLVSPASGLV